MRNIFIDLGAGSGDDIKGFYNLNPDHVSWEVYAFECNSDRIANIKKRFPKATVIAAAAGVEDTTANFYLSKSLNSNSLYQNKTGVNKNNYKQVQVINICRWMKENFTSDDNIVIVIDIEGAEYDLLAGLKQQDMLSWINELYVEFHGKKLKGFDIAIEHNWVKELKEFYQDKVYIYEYFQHERFIILNNESR